VAQQDQVGEGFGRSFEQTIDGFTGQDPANGARQSVMALDGGTEPLLSLAVSSLRRAKARVTRPCEDVNELDLDAGRDGGEQARVPQEFGVALGITDGYDGSLEEVNIPLRGRSGPRSGLLDQGHGLIEEAAQGSPDNDCGDDSDQEVREHHDHCSVDHQSDVERVVRQDLLHFGGFHHRGGDIEQDAADAGHGNALEESGEEQRQQQLQHAFENACQR
jgi:hypothetical protein